MKTRRIILILFALLGFSISAVLSQTTLRDILSDESCQYACYLGIKPGESSQLELENILNALEIEYEVTALGLDGSGGDSYSFAPPNPSSFIVNNQDGVGILVSPSGIVVQIGLLLNPLPISDLLDWYGAPSRVADDGSVELIYPSEGLVFSV